MPTRMAATYVARMALDPTVARKTWRTLEPYHGLVYFAPEAAPRYGTLGVQGFGQYFASRAAALGPVGPDVVVATFFNFNPAIVHAAVPSAWTAAEPARWLEARLDVADAALRRCLGDDVLASTELVRAAALIRPAADAVADIAVSAGRPLALAHAAVERPGEAHLALWHSVTVLREHRGDGHVSCLVEAGLDGCGALVQHAASGEVPRSVLQTTRGWRDDDWHAAVHRLADRGWVDGDGAATDAGRAARDRIEARTDELAAAPWAAIGEEACEELRSLVRPLSKAIVAAGGLGR
jgi:hypothetical protein